MSSGVLLEQFEQSSVNDLPRLDCRTALLINYITRHQLPVFEALQKLLVDLRVLVSVEMEPQRDYDARFGSLDVTVQKNWTLKKTWKHNSGFEDNLNVQVPYDTFSQLRRYRPDVVVSFELGMRSVLSAMYRSLHRKSKLLLAINVSEVTESSWGMSRRLVRPWLLRRADAVTYNGPSCHRYLQTIVSDNRKLNHFPYAADPESLHHGSHHRDDETRKRLLCVGQLTARKNPAIFLQQLIRWCENNEDKTASISFVGRGPLQTELESLSKPKNLDIDWIGVIDPVDMPDVWHQHGLLAFPTLADEWGMVVNEAMQSGLPVLGSCNAQSSETLIKNDNGWLFEPENPASVYNSIDLALNTSNADLNLMAMNARTTASTRTPQFSAECMYTAISNILTQR